MKVDLTSVGSRTIRSRLTAMFCDVMYLQVPSDDTDLFDTGILDSQRFVELLLFLEQNFHVQIDLEHFEIENFRTVEKIAALILRQREENRLRMFSVAGMSAG